jgi:hypothetical protein
LVATSVCCVIGWLPVGQMRIVSRYYWS